MNKLLGYRIPFSHELPTGWKYVSIGDVVTERDEKNPNLQLYSVTKENGIIPQTESSKRDTSSSDKSRYKVIKRGDIVYNTMRMWQGVVSLSNVEAIVSPAYTVCTLNDNLDGKFAEYLFRSYPMVRLFNRFSQGLVDDTNSLKFEAFSKLYMPFPPILEQRKIAAILACVDDSINATQRIIDQTEVVKHGLMQQLLTKGIGHTTFKQTEIGVIPSEWEIVRLDDLAELVTSGSRGWSQYYSTHGALFIRSQDIGDAHLKTGERAYVQVPDGVEGQRTRVQFRDLLISITGNPGNVAMAPSEIGDAFVSQHVALVRLLRPELSPFLTYFLCGDMGQRQFDGNAYGQTRPGLNLKNIRELVVPIPSREEQAKIVKVLDSVDFKLKAEFAHYEQLHNVKRGLMQVLLTGKVRVNVDEPSEVSV